MPDRRFRGSVECLERRDVPSSFDLFDDISRVTTLTATTATLTGTAELHISGPGDPLAGSTIKLDSPDAWLFLDNILPSTVASTFLSRVQVNGVPAVLDSNVRVVQYGVGAVVIPHSPTFQPLTVYTAGNFGGTATPISQYTAYSSTNLGTLDNAISSFKLKRGYTATLASNSDGTGTSVNYVAQDGDLNVPVLPSSLNDSVSFLRVFPWRWTSKKGIAGNIGQQLDVQWRYNWNIDQNSTPDREYVAIRQSRWWPSLNQNWQTRGVNTVLGYNEPDHADQANLTVGDALWSWPDLLGTGLRVGAPAVSDGGLSWLYSFMSQAEAEGKRVDFVPVHYYRSHNPADPSGAATQFYNYLKGIYDTVKRPLWVTEWNNGANWTGDADPTSAQQAAAISAMVDMLESTPFVERYAIYNWVEDVRRVQWDDSAGTLTQAGQVYRDKESALSYRQELPDPGTSANALYTFGGDANDSNGHMGLEAGTPTYGPGVLGRAVNFDGQNDSIQISPKLGDSTDFTFAGWVNWSGGASWQRIFDLGLDTSHYLFLSPKSSGGSLRFAINDGGGEQQLSATALPAGVWTHVAVTISGSTGKLFVNGEVVATNTAMTLNPVDIGTLYNYLGKSRFSADPLFAGTLDDVRFSSTALTDAEIATLAARVQDYGFETPATANLIYNPTGSPWTFSGASGNGSGVTANNSAFTSGNAVAPQGTQVAFLQSSATITQTLTGLEPGRTYQISFAASQRQNKVGGQAGETFDVTIDSTVIGSFEPPQSLASYTTYTTTFVASAATQTLRFVGTNLHGGDNTAFLDRVRLTTLNTAPVLAATAPLVLDTVPVLTSNAGTLVSGILANAATDTDPLASQGIAVTGVDNANGTWQFSTNSGNTWTNFGTPSAGSARLLAADVATRVRFVPNTGFFGTATITLRAWDRTIGANGGTASTTTNGGTTAFSTATAAASITLATLNVNDGAVQRSRLTKIAVNLPANVDMTMFQNPGTITLTRTSGGPTTTVTVGSGLVVTPGAGASSTITLTFQDVSLGGVAKGSLIDGRWQLAIPGLGYTSTLNDVNLRRLYGDADANGTVNALDLAQFGNSFGYASVAFDFDTNGQVNALDLAEFGNRFGLTL